MIKVQPKFRNLFYFHIKQKGNFLLQIGILVTNFIY